MKMNQVMKAVEELICRQEDSANMALPVVTVIESSFEYNTLWIELVDGSKFAIHISRLRDKVRI